MPRITLALGVDADKFHGLVQRLRGAGIDMKADVDIVPDLEGCRSSYVVTGRNAEAARARINDYLSAYQPDWRPIAKPFADMNPAEKAAFLNFATRDCRWTDEEPPELEELVADYYEHFCASYPRLFAPAPYETADGARVALVRSVKPGGAGRAEDLSVHVEKLLAAHGLELEFLDEAALKRLADDADRQGRPE